jgi:diacylglycerol kinase (ATP)
MRLALVVNPRAGGGRGARIAASVSDALRAAGEEHEVHISTHGGEPERLARAAAERDVEVVVAVGGDGHVAAVANGILGSGSALAVIPAGNGNDFARNLGLPWRDRAALVRLLQRGQATVRSVDVGHVSTADGERHFLNVAGAGFDSVVTARGEQVRRLGRYRYLYATFETLVRFKPGPFVVTVDGERHEAPAMFVAVGNAPAYGNGMRITPGASLDDGMLEVCVVGALSRLRFVRLFPLVYSGRHIEASVVRIFRGSVVELESTPVYEVFADGERVGTTPARLTVRPAALPVLMPISRGT